MNLKDYILVLRSDYEETEPQWEIKLSFPSEKTEHTFKISAFFFLVLTVADSLKFRREGKTLIFVPITPELIETTWHTDIGEMIERHFQMELQQLAHPDWDRFNIGWYPKNFLQ